MPRGGNTSVRASRISKFVGSVDTEAAKENYSLVLGAERFRLLAPCRNAHTSGGLMNQRLFLREFLKVNAVDGRLMVSAH